MDEGKLCVLVNKDGSFGVLTPGGSKWHLNINEHSRKFSFHEEQYKINYVRELIVL